MCLLFCYCVIQGVSFNYHHRNVRSRVSVSNFQVWVSEVTVSTTSLGITIRLKSLVMIQMVGMVVKCNVNISLGYFLKDK